jgi:excinuclease ABC subunit B
MTRRREAQERHNRLHGVRPVSIHKSVEQVRFVTRVADARTERPAPESLSALGRRPQDREELIAVLERQMREAAAELDFELAAQLRDQIFELKAAGDPARSSPAGTPARSPAAAGRRRRG